MDDPDDESRRREGYLRGRSAVKIGGEWVVAAPTAAPPVSGGSGDEVIDGFAIITSDNPYGEVRAPEENDSVRLRLRERLESWGPLFETVGGSGDGGPEDWVGVEKGWAVRMSREEAAMVGHEFGQEAVYVIEGADRVLLSCTDSPAAVQRCSWHRAPTSPGRTRPGQ